MGTMNRLLLLTHMYRPLGIVLNTLSRLAVHSWARRAVFFLLVGGGLTYEYKTSTLQAYVFSHYAARLSYAVTAGPSSHIVFPQGGPFNTQRGYAQLPKFQTRLAEAGYHITQQVRMSPELTQLLRWGISPPYREPTATGLTLRDAHGLPVYENSSPTLLFQRFEDIPPLITQTLLFIEN